MPPTDNEDPGSPTTAAGAQITEQQAKAQSDGVSVEVLLPLFLQVHRGRGFLTRIDKRIGPPPSTSSNATTRQKRPTARYSDSKGCVVGYTKGSYSVCLVFIFPVCYTPCFGHYTESEETDRLTGL
jgi:hypothetical protein